MALFVRGQTGKGSAGGPGFSQKSLEEPVVARRIFLSLRMGIQGNM